MMERVGALALIVLAGGTAPAAAGSGDADATPGFVAFVSALGSDAVIRFRDADADGRLDGPGDAVVYFGPGNAGGFPGVGSAQSLLALGPDDVLAADGERTGGFVKRVYRLRDLDADGTAMGADESAVFWDSRLPLPGFPLADRPKEMLLVPGGAASGPGGVPPILLADNNTINFSGTTPEAIWRLDDLNADGSTDTDAGEVSLFHEFAPAGDAFGFITEDFRFHPDGRLFFSNQVSSGNSVQVWVRQTDGTLSPFFDDDVVIGTALKPTGMALHPVTNNPVLAGADAIANTVVIVELVDLNANGFIDGLGELRVLYRADTAAAGIAFDFNSTLDVNFAPDGSLWLLDISDDAILRFADLDADGRYQSAGEAAWIYQASDAQAGGGLVIDFPRTVVFAELDPGCPADLAEPFGVLNFFDLSTYLALYTAQDPAADLAPPAGVFNFFDMAAYLDLYGQGCP